MDFSSLKQKLQDATKPLMEKAAPLLDKAKDAWAKALDFTQKQLQNTPVVLKTVDELTNLKTNKRVIVIAYDQSHTSSREVLLRSPVWMAKAFSDIAELRFVESGSSSDLTNHLGISTPLDMHVWYIGEETFRSTALAEILGWWDSRCYDGKDESRSPEKKEASSEAQKMSPDAPSDPLAGK
jgi:hypothetical protein